MRHRHDIDGLRAVAVVPIVLFHAGVEAISGGFVGVDIFFVISGYLITCILIKDMDAGRFSIMEFYRRRAVRIFPALLTMVLIALIWGRATLLPVEVRALGQSAMATTLFLSNVYFWQDADYFASAAETKPLLHTWSLGVEEQFYLFFPLFLLLVRRYLPARTTTLLAMLCVASVALSAAMMVWSRDAAFYLLPSRSWELALGGLAAVASFPRAQSAKFRSVATTVGLLCIILALFLIRPRSPFPMPWAMLPAVGALLLIVYGDDSHAGRLLSLSPMRWLGRISYSLYLWHWPIITFYRLDTGFELNRTETVGLVGASLLAATLSYHLIEQPLLRRFRSDGTSGRVLAFGAGGLVVTTVAGLLVVMHADSWQRFDPQVRKVAAYGDYRNFSDYQYQFRKGVCFRGETEENLRFEPKACLTVSADKSDVIVMGDSHAAQYWRAFSLRYPEHNVIQATASGCRPLLDGSGAQRCVEVMRYVFGPLIDSGEIEHVVLAGRWSRTEVPALVKTALFLRERGIDVTVIGPTVEYEGEMPSLLARAMMQKDMGSMHQHRLDERRVLDQYMQEALSAVRVPYVSAYQIECAREGCRLVAPDGGPMQFDYGHLTLSAAKWVVDQMIAL